MLGALMPTNLWARLHALLSRPLFGTKVIPRDARVDPAEFPEDEFPVYCPKCHYLLRGLPDGRCPECGDPFDRGRLLVVRYVESWEKQPELRPAKTWAVAGLILVLITLWMGTKVVSSFVIDHAEGVGPAISNLQLALLLTAVILFVVLIFLCFRFFYYRSKTAIVERDIKRKRQLVLDAIEGHGR